MFGSVSMTEPAHERRQRLIGIGPCFTLGCVLFPLPLVLVPLASGSELVIAFMLGLGTRLRIRPTDLDYNAR